MKRFVIFAAFLLLLSVPVFAEEPIYMYDGADLLTEAAEYTYIDHAGKAYAEHNLLCVVVTGEYFSTDALTAALPTYSYDAVDMVLLSVDMGKRHFDLYQYNAVSGESAFRISFAETDEILDGIFDDIADGNYLDAFLDFVDRAVEAFENEQNFSAPASEYRDDYQYVAYKAPKAKNLLAGLGKALLIGAIAGGIAVFGVRLSYRKKVHGDTYPLSEYSKLDLTATQDNFINKTVTMVKIPDPPQNHSGGGGSHGGGGFHGGGGGAHMGGRSF